jgi:DNA-binding NtrC family response regulator
MEKKNIVLFEHYDGVRFILERSLSKSKENFNILSSNQKTEIKNFLNEDHVDLLITELSSKNPDGLEISRYARRLKPNIKIIWITVLGCDVFRELKNKIGNIKCIEKPLEITDFRRNVYKALDIGTPEG